MVLKTLRSKLILIVMISALALSACNMGSTTPTATPVSVDAIYTAAAQTLAAQMATSAAAQPSATLTLTPTGTSTVTMTPAVTQTTAAGVLPPVSGGSGCNNSAYVADVTIPDGQQVAPGQTFTKTWRFQNTGSCAWNTGFKIYFISGELMSGATTAITQTVGAGASADVSVSLTAPASPKTYTGYWRLMTDTGQPFGMTVSVKIVVAGTPTTPGTGTVLPSITPTYGAVGCNNSAFVSDVTIPDGTQIKAGDSFTKTWRIKNAGTCAWNGNYKFYFDGGALMGSDTTKIRRTVAVGATTDFSLDFVAPNSPGTYIGYWRMMADDGTLFGVGFSVKIVVPGATFTPTLTPSITLTPTPVPATLTPTVTKAAYP